MHHVVQSQTVAENGALQNDFQNAKSEWIAVAEAMFSSNKAVEYPETVIVLVYLFQKCASKLKALKF